MSESVSVSVSVIVGHTAWNDLSLIGKELEQAGIDGQPG